MAALTEELIDAAASGQMIGHDTIIGIAALCEDTAPEGVIARFSPYWKEHEWCGEVEEANKILRTVVHTIEALKP
jgi:hypothetical protein